MLTKGMSDADRAKVRDWFVEKAEVLEEKLKEGRLIEMSAEGREALEEQIGRLRETIAKIEGEMEDRHVAGQQPFLAQVGEEVELPSSG